MSHLAASSPDVADEVPRLSRRYSRLHNVVRHVDKPLSFWRNFADRVHARGVREVAVKVCGNVNVENIARL